MRDWGELVRGHLGGLNLTAAQQQEIVAELAGHLEDVYEERRAQGLSKSQAFEAVERALDEVTDWRRLARKIRRAKREEKDMNNRTKQFWLPTLISVTATSVFLMALALFSELPRITWMRSEHPFMLFYFWLLAQPLFGAITAYMSRRGGGEPLTRIAASLFPAIALFVMICLLFLSHAFMNLPGEPASFEPATFAWAIFVAVVVPGAATLLGALPFLRASKLRHS